MLAEPNGHITWHLEQEINKINSQQSTWIVPVLHNCDISIFIAKNASGRLVVVKRMIPESTSINQKANLLGLQNCHQGNQ